MGRLVKEKVWSVISKGKSTDDQFSEEEKEIIAKGIISSQLPTRFVTPLLLIRKPRICGRLLKKHLLRPTLIPFNPGKRRCTPLLGRVR